MDYPLPSPDRAVSPRAQWHADPIEDALDPQGIGQQESIYPFLEETLHVESRQPKALKGRVELFFSNIRDSIRSVKYVERADEVIFNKLFGHQKWSPSAKNNLMEVTRIMRIMTIATLLFAGTFITGWLTGASLGMLPLLLILTSSTYAAITSKFTEPPSVAQIYQLVELIDPMIQSLREMSEIPREQRGKSIEIQDSKMTKQVQAFMEYVLGAMDEIKSDESIEPALRAARLLSFFQAIDTIIDHYRINETRVYVRELEQSYKARETSVREALEDAIGPLRNIAERSVTILLQQGISDLQRMTFDRKALLKSGAEHNLHTAEEEIYTYQAEDAWANRLNFSVEANKNTSEAFENIQPLIVVQEPLREIIAHYSGVNEETIDIPADVAQKFADTNNDREAINLLNAHFQVNIPENDISIRDLFIETHLSIYRKAKAVNAAMSNLTEYRQARLEHRAWGTVSKGVDDSLLSAHSKISNPDTECTLLTMMARDIASYMEDITPENVEKQVAEKLSTHAAKLMSWDLASHGDILNSYVYQVIYRYFPRTLSAAQDQREQILEDAYEIEKEHNVSIRDVTVTMLEEANRKKLEADELSKKHENDADHTIFIRQYRKNVEDLGDSYEPTAREKQALRKIDQAIGWANVSLRADALKELLQMRSRVEKLEAFLRNVEAAGRIR